MVHALAYGQTGDITPTAADFASAQTAPFAYVVASDPAWIRSLPSDPSAKWIATTPNLSQGSALFAVPFQVTDPVITSASLDFHFSVDNAVNGAFINGTRISGNSFDGDYHAEYRFVRNDIAPLLIPNATNWLYVNMSDYGFVAGIIFSATITTSTGGVGTVAISPTHGGNTGTVTVQVNGTGFQPGAQLRLSGVGSDIVGKPTTVLNPSTLVSTMDLTGAQPGPRSVVVTNPNGSTTTLSAAFTVEQGGSPEVWVDIIGPDRMRVGREQTFYVAYGNQGTLDAYDVPLFVTVPTGVQVSISGLQVPAGTAPPADWNATPTIPTSSGTLIPIWFYLLRAGSSGVIPISLISPGDTSITAEISQPIDSEFARTGNVNAIPPHLDAFFKQLAHQLTLANTGARSSAGTATSIAPRVQSQSACAGLPEDLQDLCWQDNFRTVLPAILRAIDPRLVGTGIALGLAGAGLAASGIAAGGGILLTGGAVLLAFEGGLALWHLGELSLAHWHIQKQLAGVQSVDPNDLVGPTGFGSPRYVASTQFGYTVFFENQAAATAPAQTVTITDILNANFDLSTLTVGPISLPTQVVNPQAAPLSVAPFTTTVDLRPATNLLVKIDASLDASARRLIWTFQSVDPATGLPPTDPLAGFLPPGAGGSVFFTVQPKSTVATGTVIQNTAAVTFDVNTPINTPTWSNTIDNTNPVSRVAPLPANQTSNSFPVQWSGNDVGAGVQDFTIFVSQDGSPFTAWQANTAATSGIFTGRFGSTYSFYSVAHDLVGNVENAQTSSQASTRVQADPTPPTTTATVGPTPNQAGWNNSSATVRLNAVDIAGPGETASGVKQITYSASGAQTIPLTTVAGASAAINITSEGQTTITFFATDNAGNVEAQKTLVVKLDKTAPVTVASANPPPNAAGWNNQANATVTLTARDDLSGVAKTEFNLDGVGWIPYTAPISVSTEGKHALQYRSVDLAGNIETTHMLPVNIDRTPPTVSCATMPNVLWPPDHKLVLVNAAVSVTDALSGPGGFALTSVASNEPDQGLGDGDTPNDIEGWVVGASSTSGQLRAERSGTGTGRVYTLTYTAADQAGNTATCAATVTVPHDKSP